MKHFTGIHTKETSVIEITSEKSVCVCMHVFTIKDVERQLCRYLQNGVYIRAIQVLDKAMVSEGGRGILIRTNECYEGVRANVIIVTRACGGVQFPEKSVT